MSTTVSKQMSKLVEKQLPTLGIICKATTSPEPVAGTVDHPESWKFPIVRKVVPGLTLEALEKEELPSEVQANFEKALEELKAEGCVAVTSNLSETVVAQSSAFKKNHDQVFFSPLLQLPTLLCGFGDDDKILVVSVHTKEELKENAEKTRAASGTSPYAHPPQLAVLTCDEKLNDDALVAKVKKMIEDDSTIRAIVLERPSLASSGDALREATGLGVYEAFTCVDAFLNGYLDNPNFGESNWQHGTARTQDSVNMSRDKAARDKLAARKTLEMNKARKMQPLKKDCSLGVVRLDYNYEAAPGDIDHPGSYDHDVYFRAVPRLTFNTCQGGPDKKREPGSEDGWDDEVQSDYLKTIDWLVNEKKVNVIAADCGFFMWFQEMARKQTQGLPVTMSSLAMLPTLVAALAPQKKIAIFTANSKSLEPMRGLIQKECGLDKAGISLDDERLIIVGCQDVEFFGAAVQNGDKVDTEKATPPMVKLALETLEQHRDVAVFLFECTELPQFSDSVREKTGLPVYDAITTVQFFLSGFADNPRVGKADWQAAWDHEQEEFHLGKYADAADKSKFVSLK